MNNFLYFLKKSEPFLITLFLWRLSVVFWNPSGILALIPIFYYTFVKPINWFALFGLIFCFLIDYRCNLPLFWTTLFCVFYAINGFQSYIEVQNIEKNALYIFMLFSGVGFFILTCLNLNWNNFINNLWLFIWVNVLYIPITSLDNLLKYKGTQNA
ncbi:MAG: hypothetical protein J6S57_03690 [Alphaproteobacteria bacterium]|nr:hypothetical protein [Alphaproteobacteria bacterium]